jgi:hypothetical protein
MNIDSAAAALLLVFTLSACAASRTAPAVVPPVPFAEAQVPEPDLTVPVERDEHAAARVDRGGRGAGLASHEGP